MKKLTLLLILSLPLLWLEAQTWTQKSNLPDSARFSAMAFSNGGFGYICNGSDSNDDYYRDLWQYDPINDSWTRKDSFPAAARRSGVAFTIDSFSYVGLGWENTTTTFYKDLLRYNPSANSWDTVSSYPGVGARGIKVTTYKGKAYLGGGNSRRAGPALSEFYEYDPATNTWTSKANLPQGVRVGGVMFTIDSLIYYGLGQNFSTDFKDLWSYDVTTDSWTQRATFPGVGRLNASAFVLNGKAIVGGGYPFAVGNELSDYYRYNPLTDTWDTLSTFAAGKRAVSETFVINNKGYLLTGWDSTNTALKDLWEYTDTTNATSIVAIANDANMKLSLYPNPSNGIITFALDGEQKQYELFILDELGREIMHQTLGPLMQQHQINLSRLPSGTYFYRLNNREHNYTGKLIIQN